MSWLSDKWQDFKAWRRGEKRVRHGRGRVYAKKDGTREELYLVKTTPVATLTAKVTRADGTVEVHEAHNVRVDHGNSGNDSRP